MLLDFSTVPFEVLRRLLVSNAFLEIVGVVASAVDVETSF